MFSAHTETYSDADALNEALATLTIIGSERGAGQLSLSVDDGFAPALTKKVFFKVPNTAPVLDITDGATSHEIGTKVFIKDSGVLAEGYGTANIGFSISDNDTADANLLKVGLKFNGAKPEYNGDYGEFVSVRGNNVVISQADDAVLPSGYETWASLVSDLVSEIEFTKLEVGSVSIDFAVEDGLGARDCDIHGLASGRFGTIFDFEFVGGIGLD